MLAQPPNTSLAPSSATDFAYAISPIEEIVAQMRAGRMVILVDEQDRENEGDLVLAADFVTPEAINFMAKYGRGLICLTLTPERCEHLQLPMMASQNGSAFGTAFTVSIEAATGVTTGISAADRARTIAVAVAKDTKASDLVQPGHVFPLRAVAGGVLMRAGHTEAGCDLAHMAGCSPASVICEIMKDDGTMARLPDLVEFAAQHQMKIGTIADLIAYRSRTESLLQEVCKRPIRTAYGEFELRVFQDSASRSLHFALIKGQWPISTSQGHSATDNAPAVLVRVHEPLSILDVLETGRTQHSWPLEASLQAIEKEGQGLLVLLNVGDTVAGLLAQLEVSAQGVPSNTHSPVSQGGESGSMGQALRTYGIGAQIIRSCGVRRMRLMGAPRKMPSMTGYGLEIVEFVTP